MGAASDPRSNAKSQSRYDYPRLERAVEALIEAHDRQRADNSELRVALEARDERLGDLEAALRDQQQRRADAIARIDALVGELEELDARLERAEESRSGELAAGAVAP